MADAFEYDHIQFVSFPFQREGFLFDLFRQGHGHFPEKAFFFFSEVTVHQTVCSGNLQDDLRFFPNGKTFFLRQRRRQRKGCVAAEFPRHHLQAFFRPRIFGFLDIACLLRINTAVSNEFFRHFQMFLSGHRAFDEQCHVFRRAGFDEFQFHPTTSFTAGNGSGRLWYDPAEGC